MWQETIDQNYLIVNMVLKPEELDEVVVTKITFPKVGPADENSIIVPKPPLSTGIYDGTIANGADLMAIFSLFRKKHKKTEEKFKELDFKKLAEATVPLDFFTNDLKLKPEEKELFLQFCDADPKAKILVRQKIYFTPWIFCTLKTKSFKN
ncbi:hypothetical protein ACQ9BO_04720 [Flavobacterium sp. P21]|uniref:hypothetical protein n=1 Tax=Flavobacterium sp. P21 TaxID=3423948 RepID=UPI003D676517